MSDDVRVYSTDVLVVDVPERPRKKFSFAEDRTDDDVSHKSFLPLILRVGI